MTNKEEVTSAYIFLFYSIYQSHAPLATSATFFVGLPMFLLLGHSVFLSSESRTSLNECKTSKFYLITDHMFNRK